jgi:hypothetical protein
MATPPAKRLDPLFSLEPIALDTHDEQKVLQGCDLCQHCLLVSLLMQQKRERCDAGTHGQPSAQKAPHHKE